MTKQRDFHKTDSTIKDVASLSFVGKHELRSLIISGWENAVSQALEDHILSREEENALAKIADFYSLTDDEKSANGASFAIIQAKILRDIYEGNLFEFPLDGIRLPFIVPRSETVVWLFDVVNVYELQTSRSLQSYSVGIGAELSETTYLSTAATKTELVEDQEVKMIDTGLMGVTNKQIYFSGNSHSFRIKLTDIVSLTDFQDGVGVSHEGRGGSVAFSTGQGWFTYNLIYELVAMG